MEKQRMEMFMNYEDEEEDEFDEVYKEQFRQMTDEDIILNDITVWKKWEM